MNFDPTGRYVSPEDEERGYFDRNGRWVAPKPKKAVADATATRRPLSSEAVSRPTFEEIVSPRASLGPPGASRPVRDVTGLAKPPVGRNAALITGTDLLTSDRARQDVPVRESVTPVPLPETPARASADVSSVLLPIEQAKRDLGAQRERQPIVMSPARAPDDQRAAEALVAGLPEPTPLRAFKATAQKYTLIPPLIAAMGNQVARGTSFKEEWDQTNRVLDHYAGADPEAARLGVVAAIVGPELLAAGLLKGGLGLAMREWRKLPVPARFTDEALGKLLKSKGMPELLLSAAGGAAQFADDPQVQVAGMMAPAAAMMSFVGKPQYKSRLEEFVNKFGNKREHTAADWITRIVDPKGAPKGAFAKDEFEYGLGQVLREVAENDPQRMLTKQDLLQIGAENGWPLEEVVRKGRTEGSVLRAQKVLDNARESLGDARMYLREGDEVAAQRAMDEANKLFAKADELKGGFGDAAYGQYVSPGPLRNYREVLVTEPRLAGLYESPHYAGTGKREPWTLERLSDPTGAEKTFGPGPGPATMTVRFSDRGENFKTLGVEEVQNDLYQEARKKGSAKVYPGQAEEIATDERRIQELFDLQSENKLTPAMERELSSLLENTPDKPPRGGLEGADEDLIVSRIIDEATSGVPGRYEKIVIAGAPEQVARYGTDQLSWKQVGDGTVEVTHNALEVRPRNFQGTHAPSPQTLTIDPALGLDEAVLRQRHSTADPAATPLLEKNWARITSEPEGVIRPRQAGMEAAYGPEGRLANKFRARGAVVNVLENGDLEIEITDAMRKMREEGFTLRSPMAAGGAAVGAASGLMETDEEGNVNPAAVLGRGLLGAAAGAGLNAGMKLATRPGIRNSLSPVGQAAIRGVESFIDFGGRRARLAAQAAETGGTVQSFNAFDRFLGAIHNDREYLEKAGEAWHAAGLRPSRNPRMLTVRIDAADHIIKEALLGDGLRNVNGKVLGPSLKNVLEPLGGSPQDIKDGLSYLVAKRIVGRGIGAVGGDKLKFANASVAVQEAGSLPAVLEFEKRWTAFVDGLGEYAVEAGLFNREQWHNFKQSDALYIPLNRIHAEMRRHGVSGRGMVNVDNFVKKFVGSQRVVADPGLAIVEYAEQIVRRSDRHRIGRSLFQAADDLGEEAVGIKIHATKPAEAAEGPGIWNVLAETYENDPSKNNLIWHWTKDGERQYATITDPALYRVMASVNREHFIANESLRHGMNIAFAIPKRIFTAGTTGIDFGFSIGTNIIRDFPTLLAQTIEKAGARDVLKGFVTSLHHEVPKVGKYLPDYLPELHEIRQAGLGGVSAFTNPRSARAYQRRLVPTTGMQKLRGVAFDAVQAPLKVLEVVGDVSDLGPRAGEAVAAFRNRIDKVGQGWSKADLLAYTATRASDVTLNFAKRPGNIFARAGAEYVPFFGATTNALSTFAKAMRRNPKRALAVSGSVALVSAISWAAKKMQPGAEDTVDDMNVAYRSTGINFPVPDGEGGFMPVRIPVAQEVGLFANAMQAILDEAFDSDPHAGQLMVQSFINLVPGLSTPLLGGVYDVARNKRDFTESPIISRGMEDKLPEFQRNPETAPIYDVMAGAIRHIPGFKKVAPLQVEHVIARVISRLPKTAFDALTTPLAEALGGGKSVAVGGGALQSPLNPFRPEFPNPKTTHTASRQDYEEVRDRFEGATASMPDDEDGSIGATETRLKLGSQYPELQFAEVFKDYGDRLSTVRKERDEVMSDFQRGDLTKRMARTSLDRLAVQERGIYKEAAQHLRLLKLEP